MSQALCCEGKGVRQQYEATEVGTQYSDEKYFRL